MLKRAIIVSQLLTVFVGAAQATPVTVTYTATLGFDPTATVGVGGENAATLIDELFGPGIGSTGSASVTGSFTYDSDTPAFNSNVRGAGYTNAVIAASINFDNSSATASISGIAANAASSTIGYNTNPSSGFCSSLEGCAAVGLAFTPTGNLVTTVNDSDFFLIREGNTVNYFDRDAVFLGAGFTGTGEFSPSLPAPSFGSISVDGVLLGFISDADKSLVDSVALPDAASFVTSDEVETTVLEISFIGNNLIDDFLLTGELTDFVINPGEETPTVIPLPSTLTLLWPGLVGLMLAGGVNRTKEGKV